MTSGLQAWEGLTICIWGILVLRILCSASSGFESLGSGLGVQEAGFGSLTQAFRFRRPCLGTEAIPIVASRFVWAILGPMCLLFSQSGKSKGLKASPYSLLNLVWHDMPP